MRREVDDELRLMLENLKAMVDAEKAAKSGKKGKGGKKGGKKGKKGGKKGKKDKKGGKKGRKDLTADVSIEYLYAELVQNDIITALPPEHTFASFVAVRERRPLGGSQPRGR